MSKRAAARGLEVALERSRSGQGAHLWLFFDEALPASLARSLGCHILTQTMERQPEIGLSSYDRLFPCQDTLPQGGLGNLIALPFQHGPRAQGNSVFVDDDFAPWPDQWAFLSSLARASRLQVGRIVEEAERKGQVLGVRLPPQDDERSDPWAAPPSRRRRDPPITGELPHSLELVLGNQIYIAKEGLNPSLRNRLVRLAAFQNPEFYEAQAARRFIYHRTMPRIIACAEDHPRHIGLPRGCLDDVQELLGGLGIGTTFREERAQGRPLAAGFLGELRPQQVRAAEAILAHDTGVLAATTGFGKTVIAAWLIAQRGVGTLVLVHRDALMDQWVERLATHLGIPAKDIGRIGGGRRRPTGVLDVGMIQSLVRDKVVDDRVADYGQLIIDECHHVAADSFEAVARQAKARYVLGLSATVVRKDRRHPAIFMQCGPVRHRVDARAQAALRPFTHNVYVRPTSFQSARSPEQDPRAEFQSLCSELVRDEARTRRICDDIVEAVRAGRSPLVLTERKEHLDKLEEILVSRVQHVIALRAGMGKKQQRGLNERLVGIPRDEERVLIATGRHVGEGFDDPRLDTLFLTLPVAWKGTIAQYAGRLHRLYDGKREARIYDYADVHVPALARMLDRRCRGYTDIGYTIMMPAGAASGSSTGIVLPAAPTGRGYAARVLRHLRGPVDSPQGDLFAPSVRTDATERSRSETEAFLFHRLEALEETKGRFRLNESLPIAAAACGTVKVGLLCPDPRVAIVLDSPQQLAGADAYRRERHKDQLLQEQGYIVLRFLTEDADKDLDGVINAIVRVLARK